MKRRLPLAWTCCDGCRGEHHWRASSAIHYLWLRIRGRSSQRLSLETYFLKCTALGTDGKLLRPSGPSGRTGICTRGPSERVRND